MSKKSLLCCTAVTAIALFSTSFNAQAKFFDVLSGETKELSSGTHEAIRLQKNSKFIGKNLTITGKANIGDGLTAGKTGIHSFSKGSIDLENVTIKSESSNENEVIINAIAAFNGTQVKMKGGSIEARVGLFMGGQIRGVKPSKGNILEDVKILGSGYKLYTTGVKIDAEVDLTLKNVTIANTNRAIDAKGSAHVTISGGSFDGEISSMTGAVITLNDGATVESDNDGFHIDGSEQKTLNSMISMTGGSLTAKKSAFFVSKNATINVTDVASVKAEQNGIKFNDTIYRKHDITSEVNLTNTKLFVENGTGILVNSARGKTDLKNAEIHANILLDAKNDKSDFILNADKSILKGDAKISKDSKTVLNLKNGTVWNLTVNTIEKDKDGNLIDIAQRSHSDVSVLNLESSEISFDVPKDGQYQTLHIGSGTADTKAVYNASGDAKIGFNVAWSNGDKIDDQKTDRLLIDGDVKGTTTIYIKSDLGNKNSVANAGKPSNKGGISLIQVSGKASEDSFKIDKGYTTLGGEPYKYILTAYGPTSTHKQADIAQNLFDQKNKDFWDFRLHKELLGSGEKPGGSGDKPGGSGDKPSGPSTEPGTPGVAAVVPQVANYTVMPTAIFHSGFNDMMKQNDLLANIRATNNYSLLFSSYGSAATLSSERGPLQYGYGADMSYVAAQAGATLTAMENQSANMHFGIFGSYGQLAFTPKDMKDVSKSSLDKWAITAFGSLQHNSGAYVDILASYGIFSGNIGNALIGNTAKLENTNTFSASATIGMEIATNMAGMSFEPQAQLVYQQLMSDTIKDDDKFIVDMKNPRQWLLRIGGNVAKAIVSEENGKNISLYGKLNFITTFGENEIMQIREDFKLDPTGSSLEGGLGINAQFSHNIALHGDVSYQQNLQKSGISGINFSGGIRYRF